MENRCAQMCNQGQWRLETRLRHRHQGSSRVGRFRALPEPWERPEHISPDSEPQLHSL